MKHKRHRILILGAGFSKLAGYPLGSELWNEVIRRARLLRGRAEKFQTDIKNYLEYKRECDGVVLSEKDLDFEDFMRFLDIEHFLGLRGSDTWSRDGNEGTIVAKTLIGKILAELTPATKDIPDLYLDFAERLQPGDYVLSFNYDVLLERILKAVGKPYRLFPNRYESVNDYGAIIDDSKEEIAVLKLHGSIDWFDRESYDEHEMVLKQAGSSEAPHHPVFSNPSELDVRKLLDGPRHPHDPLGKMYRVGHVKALYRKRLMFFATPWLLAPSTMKILYANKIGAFWDGLGLAGMQNFGLAIVGYSLPPQDEYARQVVYGIVTNYQRSYWEEKLGGIKKTPLVIVDYCQNKEQLKIFKDRYRFVNWDRATLYEGGLDQQAVDCIFDES